VHCAMHCTVCTQCTVWKWCMQCTVSLESTVYMQCTVCR